MSKIRKIPSKEADLLGWYEEIIAQANLAERAPFGGCTIIMPDGYAILENIRGNLNPQIEERGAKNVDFPLFVPSSYFDRDKTYLKFINPKVAVALYDDKGQADEPFLVNLASDVIVHESIRNWIHSYKDLPLRINQWHSAVCFRKDFRPFLDSSEHQWQKGYTFHALTEAARAEVEEMVYFYRNFFRKTLALPTTVRQKSKEEKDINAFYSYAIEVTLPDGRPLEIGSVEYFGDVFSNAANVCFDNYNNRTKYAQTASWGISSCLVGAMIMIHGDDQGLVLPPKIAPTQVAIVPITNEMYPLAYRIEQRLNGDGIRAKVDSRASVRVGAKFYESELHGVPLRIVIGPKEYEHGKVMVTFRHNNEKHITSFRDGIVYSFSGAIRTMLDYIQDALLSHASENLGNSTS